MAGCGDSNSATSAPAAGGSTPEPDTDQAGSDTAERAPGTGQERKRELAYRPSALGQGFVAAFVLIRGKEVAVIDTGIEATDAAVIGTAIRKAGRSWDDVGQVIVTHVHYDHVGGLVNVRKRASRATVYAGANDIGSIANPGGKILPVREDDEIFGLRVIDTPGHTAGHLSLIDRAASVLVVGDALFNWDPLQPMDNADDEAARSVKALAQRDFDTALFAHGPIINGDADLRVREVADGLRPGIAFGGATCCSRGPAQPVWGGPFTPRRSTRRPDRPAPRPTVCRGTVGAVQGNLGHGLSGVAQLNVSSWVAVFSIAAGIGLARAVSQRLWRGSATASRTAAP